MLDLVLPEMVFWALVAEIPAATFFLLRKCAIFVYFPCLVSQESYFSLFCVMWQSVFFLVAPELHFLVAVLARITCN